MQEVSPEVAQIIASDGQVVSPNVKIQWVNNRSLKNVSGWSTSEDYQRKTLELVPNLWWRFNDPGLYENYVLDDDPVAYYRMDGIDNAVAADVQSEILTDFRLRYYEGTGHTKSSAHVSLAAGATYDSNQSVRFDGNGYATLERKTDSLNQNDVSRILAVKYNRGFSIEAWIRPEGVTGQQSIVSKMWDIEAGNHKWDFDFRMRNQRLQMVVFDASGDSPFLNLKSEPVFSANTWYHVAFSWDGYKFAKLFVNGNEVASKQIANAKTAAFNRDPLTPMVGARRAINGNLSQPFTGRIDELVFYTYGINQSVAQHHYFRSLSMFVSHTSQKGTQGLVDTSSGVPQFGWPGPITGLGSETSGSALFSGNTGVVLYDVSDINRSVEASDDFSVEAWIDISNFTSGTQQIVSKAKTTANADRCWELYVVKNGSGAVVHGAVYVGSTKYDVAGASVANSKWTHCVLQVSGDTVSVIVNGVVATTTKTGTINTGVDRILAVGQCGAAASERFVGWISDVAFYPKAHFDAEKALTRYRAATSTAAIESAGNRFSSRQVANGQEEQTFVWAVLGAKDEAGKPLYPDGSTYVSEAPLSTYDTNPHTELEYGYCSQTVSDNNGSMASPEIILVYFDAVSVPSIKVFVPKFYAPIRGYDLLYKDGVSGSWVTVVSGGTWVSGHESETFDLDAGASVSVQAIQLKVSSTWEANQPVRIQEILPFWEEDVSADVVDFSVSKVKENTDSTIPIGITAANSVSLTLQNTDQKYNKSNTDSPVSAYIRPDVKITVGLNYVQGQSTGPNPPPTQGSYTYGEGTYGGQTVGASGGGGGSSGSVTGGSGGGKRMGDGMGGTFEPVNTGICRFAYQAGQRWVRYGGAQKEWQYLQQTAGANLSANLQPIRDGIARAHAEGLRVMLPFLSTPGWIDGSPGAGKTLPQTDTARTQTAAAVSLYAQCLDPAKDIIELWNEPNIINFNTQRGSGLASAQASALLFAKFLAVCIAKIRIDCPGLKIMVGGIAAWGDDNNPNVGDVGWTMPAFTNLVLQASSDNNLGLHNNGANNADYWASHPYIFGGGNADLTGSNPLDDTHGWNGHVQSDRMAFYLASWGVPNHAIIPNEFGEPSYGWDNNNGEAVHYDEVWQNAHAIYDYIAIDRRRAAGVYGDIEINYNLVDDDPANAYSYRDFHMGSWRSNFSPKPKAATMIARANRTIAGLTVAYSYVASNLTLTLTNNSTGATNGYIWVFGDGNTSTAASPAHTYATAGTYTVQLFASDGTDTVLAEKIITMTTGGGITSDGYPSDYGGTLTGSSTGGGTTVTSVDSIKQGVYWVDTWDISSDSMTAVIAATDESRFSQDDENRRGFLGEGLTAAQAISDMARIAGTGASRIDITEPYNDTVLRDNIAAHWTLDDPEDTNKGFRPAAADPPDNIFGSSIYVPAFYGTKPNMTFELWFKVDDRNDKYALFSYAQPARDTGGNTLSPSWNDIDLHITAGGYLVMGWMGTQGANSSQTVSVGEWHHVAMKVQAGSPSIASIYLDGVNVTAGGAFQALGNGTPKDGGQFWFGASGAALGVLYTSADTPTSHPSVLSGVIADVRMWDTLLTDAQIIDAMTQDILGLEDHLTESWDFGDAETHVIYNGSKSYNALSIWQADGQIEAVEAKGMRDRINNCHGTYVDCELGTAGPFPDEKSRSVLFNGSSSYAVVPRQDRRIPYTQTFAVEAWIKTTADGSAQVITARQNIGATSGEDFTFMLAFGRLVVKRGSSAVATGSIPITPDEWHHVVVNVFWFVNQYTQLYVDGVLDTDTTQISGGFNNAGATWLIGRESGGSYFDGYISNVAIYGDLLSAEDVLAHYRAGISKKEKVYAVVWSQDEMLWDSMLRLATADLGMFNYTEDHRFGYTPMSRLYDPAYPQHAEIQYDLSDDVDIVSGNYQVELLVNQVTVKVYPVQGVGSAKQQIWAAPDNESLAITALNKGLSVIQSGEGSSLSYRTKKNVAGVREPLFANSGLVKIGNEIIKYINKDDSRLIGLTRGMFGTEIVDHGAGEILSEVKEYNFEWTDIPSYDIQRPFLTAEIFDKAVDLVDWSFTSRGGYGRVSLNHNANPGAIYYVLEGKNPITGLDNFFHVAGVPAKVDRAAQQITEVSERLDDQIRQHRVKSITIDNEFIQDVQHATEIAKFLISNFQDGVDVISIKTMGIPHLQTGDRINIALFSALNIVNEEFWITEINISYNGGVEQTMTMRRVTS